MAHRSDSWRGDRQAVVVASESDERTVNNAARHQYRVLSDDEKEAMVWIKDQGRLDMAYINGRVAGRGARASIAKRRKIEEAGHVGGESH